MFFPKKPAPEGAGGGEDYAMPLLAICFDAKLSKRDVDLMPSQPISLYEGEDAN